MTQNLGVAERIRDRMRALGYWKHERPDVRRFCEERGYTSQYVYAWLRGRRPTLDYAKRLAMDLGVTVEWLALGHDDLSRDGGVHSKVRGQPANTGLLPATGLAGTSGLPGPTGLPTGLIVAEAAARNARGSEAERRRGGRGKVIEHPLARVGLLMERLSHLEKELQATVRSWRESEERFRGLFDNGPLGMVIFDPDTLRVLEANERFAELLGYGMEEARTAGVLDWTEPGAATEAARDMVREVVAGARPHGSQESRFVTRGGGRLWAQVTWVVIRDSEGAAQYGVEMIEDITERRAVEERLQSFVSGAPIGLYRATAAGDLLAGNPALLAILGYDDVGGCPRIGGGDLEGGVAERRQWLARLEGSGAVSDVERQMRRRDGTMIWVRDRARAIRDQDGRVQWLEGVLEDVTARRRAEEATRALAEVSRELAESLHLNQTTHTIVTRLRELLRVRRVTLFQLDHGLNRLVCVAGTGVGDSREWIGQWMPAGDGLAGKSIAEGRVLATSDLLAETEITVPEWARKWFQWGDHGSALAVPLTARGTTLGCLGIGDVRGRCFADEELDLASALADQAAIALHNARLYEEADRRRREAEVFADLARTISASLDLDTVLLQVTAGAKELCRSDLAQIALTEPGGQFVRYSSDSRAGPLGFLAIEPGKGTGGQALVTGRPFRTDSYGDDPRITKDYLPVVQAEGVVAELVVPIRTGAHIEGLLYVSNRARRAFTDADEAVLMRLADHAAIAIRNARLFGEADQRRRAAESLAEIGRLLSRSLDPDDVGRRITETLIDLMGAELAVLYRRDVATGALHAIAFAGDTGLSGVWPPVLAKGTGVVGLAVLAGRPVCSPNPLTDPRISYSEGIRATFEGHAPRSVLAIPLVVGEGVIGALGMGDRVGRVFSEDDIRLAQAFAVQAAISMENARLFAERRSGP